jgi:RNA polymerase subunit RPABC4/transcription elongation factor Spt4
MMKCPACGSASISPWRKLVIGSRVSTRCPSCQSQITLPDYDGAILLLLVMVNFALKPPLIYVGTALLAYGLLRQRFVPLIVKRPAPTSESKRDV